jgi:hypothetical protein
MLVLHEAPDEGTRLRLEPRWPIGYQRAAVHPPGILDPRLREVSMSPRRLRREALDEIAAIFDGAERVTRRAAGVCVVITPKRRSGRK